MPLLCINRINLTENVLNEKFGTTSSRYNICSMMRLLFILFAKFIDYQKNSARQIGYMEVGLYTNFQLANLFIYLFAKKLVIFFLITVQNEIIFKNTNKIGHEAVVHERHFLVDPLCSTFLDDVAHRLRETCYKRIVEYLKYILSSFPK